MPNPVRLIGLVGIWVGAGGAFAGFTVWLTAPAFPVWATAGLLSAAHGAGCFFLGLSFLHVYADHLRDEYTGGLEEELKEEGKLEARGP